MEQNNKLELLNEGLKEKTKQLKIIRDQLSEVTRDINDIKRQIELCKYGKKPQCEDCRYIVAIDFSSDGWHNLCGNEKAPCTCCHNGCEYFKPDNVYTKYLKDAHCGAISVDKVRAFKCICGDSIFTDNKDTNKMLMSMLNVYCENF